MQKRILFFMVLLSSISYSCNKLIEKKKQDIIIDAMTSGRWLVQEYKAAGNNVTSEFNGYEFQFYDNGTVQGIQNTNITNGTWVGDVNQLTITANFPGAGLPLSRLNAVWKIINTDWSYVYAYTVAGVDSNFLKMQKK